MKLPASTIAAARAGHAVLPRNKACLKCDAAKPQCQECLTNGWKCQYEDDTYRTRTQSLQDRIKELEAQIAAIEENRSSSSLPILKIQTANGSQSHLGLSSGLSSKSAHSPSSHNGSRARLTPSPTPTSADSVFSSQSSSLSPPPSISPFDTELLCEQSKLSNSGPSADVIKGLLDIFVQRHVQCGFELHVGRVLGSLQPGASEPVIPALLNAMFLMACHFAKDPELKIWENEFFKRTKQEIETNIARAHQGRKENYNSLHHLQAMSMLGLYYYFKGRLLEGHVHTAHATRFAMTLGVHKLDSRIFLEEPTISSGRVFGVERWRPQDALELGEAINLWWSCHIIETSGSALNGLPAAVTAEEITTVWPRSLSDFESGNTLPCDNYSVASLLDPQLGEIVTDVSGDNVKSLLAKATSLLSQATKLEQEQIANPQGTEEWWIRFEQVDRAINRFMETMPAVNVGRNDEELAYLVLVHTSAYCGQVQLHFVMAGIELALSTQGDSSEQWSGNSLGGLSYTRCAEACRATALAAALVADMDMSYMFLFIGLAWVCVSQTLIGDIPKLRSSGRVTQAREKELQLAVVEKSMERLVETYPVLKLQLVQLQAMKERELQG